MVESFWAVPDVATIRTPLSILREQATALTEQTNGLVVGEVATVNDGGFLLVNLSVVVPALNDYRYRLLSYRQPIALYPGTLFGPDDPGDWDTIEDEERFIDVVRNKLSSDWMKRVLGSLLSQAAAA